MSTTEQFEVFNRDLDKEISDRKKEEFRNQADEKYLIADKKKRKRKRGLRWVFK